MRHFSLDRMLSLGNEPKSIFDRGLMKNRKSLGQQKWKCLSEKRVPSIGSSLSVSKSRCQEIRRAAPSWDFNASQSLVGF
jgi:hypothetical protein